MYITVQGMADAEKQMQRIINGSKSLARTTLYVGTRTGYSAGIETGIKQPSRRLGRAAGGVFALERAWVEVLAGANSDISEGLNRVTAPGPWILNRLARWIRRLARAQEVVGTESYDDHSGALRKSIHIERGRRV